MRFDKRCVGLMVLLTTLGTHSGTGWAQRNRWMSYGPVGGYVTSLALDPQSPRTVYVGSGSGVFKSTDGGESWHAPDPDSAPDAAGINPLVVDPSNSNTIYGGPYYTGRLLKSTDGGLTWTAMSIRESENSSEIHWGWWTVVLDPRTPTRVYAGHVTRDYEVTSAGLFKSNDGGMTWRKTNLNSLQIFSLAIDPEEPEVLYVGGAGEVHRSNDGGETWRMVATGFGEVNSLVIDPQVPGTLYAGSWRGVFKSTDRGENWSEVLASGVGVWTLLVDPANPGTIYAGGAGLRKSTDGGTSWSLLRLGGVINLLALDPQHPSTVYTGTDRGLFKSTDEGTTWRSINSGLTASALSGVAVDSQNPDNVYAFSQGRIFRSTDGAQNWNEVNSNLRARAFVFMEVHPQNGSIVYAGGFNISGPGRFELFKSIDGGINWASISSGLPTAAAVRGLTIDPRNPNTLYARIGFRNLSADSVGLFKSTDGGSSWHPIGSDTLPWISIAALAIDPQNPNILYAQVDPYKSGPALFKSIDGGNTWSSIPTPGGVGKFAIDPRNPDTVYAGGAGVFKSTNGGMSWIKVMDGVIGGYWSSVNALLIDQQNPTTVYTGTSQGLFRSTDGGASWSSAGSGMPRRLSVSDLAMDPQNSSRIYAATSGGGVFATFASPFLTLDRAVYCVGDSWNLKVSNAAPASTIRLLGTSNGQAWEVSPWQVTDVDGDHEQGGTMSQDTQGNHTLRIEVDGKSSKALSFVVSNCTQ